MTSHIQQDDVVHVCDGLSCGRKKRKRNEQQVHSENASHSISFHSLDLGLTSGSKLTCVAKDTDFER